MFSSLEHLAGKERRCKHAAVAVGGSDVFIFGGSRKTSLRLDVRIFDTRTFTWKEPKAAAAGSAPAMRRWHSAVLIANKVYVWGGFSNDKNRFCNELYAFDVDEHTWSVPDGKGTVPEDMKGHSACALGNVMYIYGMLTRIEWDDTMYSGMYKLDTVSLVWSSLNTETDGRLSVFHSATLIGPRMFVFGGRSAASKLQYDEALNDDDNDDDDWCHYNDIRVFDTTTDRWLPSSDTKETTPKGREGHSAFAYNGELYIFGGSGMCEITTLNDLWKFNPRDLSWHKLSPKGPLPSPRHGMCCCALGSRIFLSGGAEGPSYYGGKDAVLGEEDVYILELAAVAQEVEQVVQ